MRTQYFLALLVVVPWPAKYVTESVSKYSPPGIQKLQVHNLLFKYKLPMNQNVLQLVKVPTFVYGFTAFFPTRALRRLESTGT